MTLGWLRDEHTQIDDTQFLRHAMQNYFPKVQQSRIAECTKVTDNNKS